MEEDRHMKQHFKRGCSRIHICICFKIMACSNGRIFAYVNKGFTMRICENGYIRDAVDLVRESAYNYM